MGYGLLLFITQPVWKLNLEFNHQITSALGILNRHSLSSRLVSESRIYGLLSDRYFQCPSIQCGHIDTNPHQSLFQRDPYRLHQVMSVTYKLIMFLFSDYELHITWSHIWGLI